MTKRQKTQNSRTVAVYSKVILKGISGKKTIKLVRPTEIDLNKFFLSVNSPFGQALLNKKVGDKVIVCTPKQDLEYEIIEVD